ncbi:nuclear transport factor 2 family protein [Streptomyces albiaxialis]|uniref:Nuclear transport factor 2 family protein n=1 Tax=Streptomyces albiaxialis TaxID=329523 RepID=A0ABN2VW66_9ACTN
MTEASADTGTNADAPTRTRTRTRARTRSAVDELLSRIAAGDPERVAALFAERVDWMIAENPGVPWIRPRETRADVAAHFAELAAGVASAPDNPRAVETVLVEGEDAVIMGMLKGHVRATGKSFRSPYVMRLTVREGRFVRYHLYEDSRAIAEACTPGT